MFKRALGLGVALIVGAMLVSASGAATTQAQKVTKINVSTRAAVVHYLRSIHVNAKHAVIQRGLRNYAGAHCPGKGWACASTKHTVVQIAKQGGQNRFVCKSSKCVVVQISGAYHGIYTSGRRLSAAAPNKGGGNSGVCVKTGSGATTGTGQTCTINQSGSGQNTAGVYENTNKVSGLTQTAQYSASITQTSTGAGNIACVTQMITLDGSASNTNTKPVAVNLNAFQTITITQNSPAGDNLAKNAADSTGACTSQTLTQSQTLTSTVTTKGQITQNQDTALINPQGNAAANVVTEIDQNQLPLGSGSGLNKAAFIQTSNQSAIANTVSGGKVTQQQDANVPNPPYSGIVGTINQDSSHNSTASATQNETQCEDAVIALVTPTTCDMIHQDPPAGVNLMQTQYGPEGIFGAPAKQSGRVPFAHKGYGKSQQTGNPDCLLHNPTDCDVFTLTQTSTQNTDNGPNTTQGNIIQGDCLSDGGSCQAGQTATVNNNTPTSDGYTAGSIDKLKINCNGQACQPTPPPSPTLTATPPVDLNGDTTATSASFEFTDPARDGTFNCTLDNNPTETPCGSPSVINGLLDGTRTYTGLSLGPHTFTVTASDSSGNTSNQPPLATFTWTVVPPCTIGAGSSSPLGYSSMPTDIVHCGPPSQAFEATSTNEFGDEVGLDTTGGTSLQSLTVDLQSYGCGDSGHWNTGATDPCMTTSGETFTVPGGIKATIYSVGPNDSVGSPLATSTINPNIPYRPSADPVNCPGSGGNGDNDTGSKWFDHVANACRYSLSYPVTFTNWSAPLTFTNGEKVIWTVQFNTSDAGYNPIVANMGTQPCNLLDRGCGYDSLNVGIKTFNNAAAYPTLTTAPYAGTDVNEDQAFRSYDSPAYSGTVVPLAAENGWSGSRPLGKIVLAP